MNYIDVLTYSSIVILLPLIPAYILYVVIPSSEDTNSVDGKFQGFNIKLKGSFAMYFILVLVVYTTIPNSNNNEPAYKLWDVTGVIDVADGESPESINISIEPDPPNQRIYPNGRFEIKNIPFPTGDNQKGILVLTKISNGKRIDEVVQLDQDKGRYEVVFNDDTVSIETPISFDKQNARSGGYPEVSENNYKL